MAQTILTMYSITILWIEIKSKFIFYFACFFGHFKVVHYFVEQLHIDIETQGVNINSPNQYGSFPIDIHIACENGALDIVQYFSEKQHIKTDILAKNNFTPLHYASQKAYLQIVKYLISNTANPFDQTTNSLTPLHYASAKRNFAVVQYFIENIHISINIKDQEDNTLLHYAFEGVFQHLNIKCVLKIKHCYFYFVCLLNK